MTTAIPELTTAGTTRLLIVEDEAAVRSTLCDIFEAEGWSVRAVADAASGLQEAQLNPPDLILSDICMPGQDGYELLQQLRSLPDLVGVPLIFLTGRATPEEIRAGMEAGADDYIVKPFDPPALVRSVRSRLQRRRAVESGLARFRESVARMLPHELRTPLVGVLGFSDLLVREAIDAGPAGHLPAETVRERARYIQQSGRRLQDLVERYTLWVELNARATELTSRRSEWRNDQVLTTLVERFRAHAHERGRLKDLQIALQPAKLGVPDGYLPPVLLQLLDNALKFSLPGQAVAVLGLATGSHYLFTVHDFGRGIPAGSLSRLGEFVQFERARWEQQGVGLGLAIAKQFAGIVGGELRIESRPTGGDTRVMLRVPLAQSA